LKSEAILAVFTAETRNNRDRDRGNSKSEVRISKQIRITEEGNDQNGEAFRFEIPHLSIRSLLESTAAPSPALRRNSIFDIRNFSSTTADTIAPIRPGFIPAFLFSA
jgi:hypothetical protein